MFLYIYMSMYIIYFYVYKHICTQWFRCCSRSPDTQYLAKHLTAVRVFPRPGGVWKWAAIPFQQLCTVTGGLSHPLPLESRERRMSNHFVSVAISMKYFSGAKKILEKQKDILKWLVIIGALSPCRTSFLKGRKCWGFKMFHS